MIHRQTFYADYSSFWLMKPADKNISDGALVAMIFAMLAMGTQFVTSNPPKENQQTAEFYVSARADFSIVTCGIPASSNTSDTTRYPSFS